MDTDRMAVLGTQDNGFRALDLASDNHFLTALREARARQGLSWACGAARGGSSARPRAAAG